MLQMSGYDYYKKAKEYAALGDIKSMVECLKLADQGPDGDPFAAPILARVYIQTALQSAEAFLKRFIHDVEEMDLPGINSDQEEYELGCVLTLLGKEEEAQDYLTEEEFTLQGLAESVNRWKDDF